MKNQIHSMKKAGLLVLGMLGFAQVSSAVEDYSKMSTNELNEALVVAVKKGSPGEVQKLIKAGANVNQTVSYFLHDCYDWDYDVTDTLLEYAARHGYADVVKEFLRTRVKNDEINEALVIAAREGHVNVVKEFLQAKPTVDVLNEALDIAILKGYSEVVEELIKGGVDINYGDDNQDTPLIKAISRARATSEFSSQAQRRAESRWFQRREIIKTLLNAGAHVNHVNKHGRTALMEAVREHDLNTVQSLLQIPEMTTGSYFGFGTKPINYADNDGNTALILAVKSVRCMYVDNQEYNICKNSQKIIEELLKTPGIDPYHVNNHGETAIELLKQIDERMSRF